jgi:hypothetical protein
MRAIASSLMRSGSTFFIRTRCFEISDVGGLTLAFCHRLHHGGKQLYSVRLNKGTASASVTTAKIVR